MLVHDVFFKLSDRSPAAAEALVAACREYLTGHDGTVLFAVGQLAKELARPVNDRDWDVGLHLVFRDQAAHDAYQAHPRHVAFVEENKPTWAGVRVFDTLCEEAKP
ncbi:MAG: Dabb family protein [Gemmataceae bacterium]|nr:Dabb family protein [Gemmataceae bacterium]